MERIVYRITLDTHKNGIQRTLQGFETADNMSRRIAVNLMSNGDTYEIPSDHVTAMIYITTPNAEEPSINACTIEGNTIVYDALPIMEEGITEMQIKLIETRVTGAKKVLVSPRFAVEVTEGNSNDESAEQTTTFTALEDAVARAGAVYNNRLLRIEIDEECIFRAHYADDTTYESDALARVVYTGDARLARSWAVGGTGMRYGEDTDNSKYYSEVSKSASIEAANSASASNEVLQEAIKRTTYTVFQIDYETGDVLYYTSSYTFDVDEETGQLMVEGGKNYSPEDLIGEMVGGFIDQKAEEIDSDLEEAVSIAKGKNQAKVFDTKAGMVSWLSDEANKGICAVGDNLYILAVDVPDWWVSEVLTEADPETGYYYKISELETQKVDVNAIIAELGIRYNQTTGAVEVYNIDEWVEWQPI